MPFFVPPPAGRGWNPLHGYDAGSLPPRILQQPRLQYYPVPIVQPIVQPAVQTFQPARIVPLTGGTGWGPGVLSPNPPAFVQGPQVFYQYYWGPAGYVQAIYPQIVVEPRDGGAAEGSRGVDGNGGGSGGQQPENSTVEASPSGSRGAAGDLGNASSPDLPAPSSALHPPTADNMPPPEPPLSRATSTIALQGIR